MTDEGRERERNQLLAMARVLGIFPMWLYFDLFCSQEGQGGGVWWCGRICFKLFVGGWGSCCVFPSYSAMDRQFSLRHFFTEVLRLQDCGNWRAALQRCFETKFGISAEVGMMEGAQGWVLSFGLEGWWWNLINGGVLQWVFAFEKCNFWTVEERGQWRCRLRCSIRENEKYSWQKRSLKPSTSRKLSAQDVDLELWAPQRSLKIKIMKTSTRGLKTPDPYKHRHHSGTGPNEPLPHCQRCSLAAFKRVNGGTGIQVLCEQRGATGLQTFGIFGDDLTKVHLFYRRWVKNPDFCKDKLHKIATQSI